MSNIETPCHKVEPAQITKALQKLWRECCDTDANDVVRSLTNNLVIVIDNAQTKQINERLQQLVEHQPCRAFVVTFADVDKVTACVHGMARRRDGVRDLLLEQIDLTVPRDRIDSLIGVVRPLLVNDIPTNILWSTEWPDGGEHFDKLCRIADHAMVDSARSDAPNDLLDQLLTRTDKPITDLAWLRVKAWRRAIAEAFERATFQPDETTQVTIRHGDKALAQSLQLGRWLESRLSAEVQLESVEDGTTRTPASIEIHNGTTVYSLEQRDRQIHIAVQEHEAWSRPFAIAATGTSEPAVLAQALAL